MIEVPISNFHFQQSCFQSCLVQKKLIRHVTMFVTNFTILIQLVTPQCMSGHCLGSSNWEFVDLHLRRQKNISLITTCANFSVSIFSLGLRFLATQSLSTSSDITSKRTAHTAFDNPPTCLSAYSLAFCCSSRTFTFFTRPYFRDLSLWTLLDVSPCTVHTCDVASHMICSCQCVGNTCAPSLPSSRFFLFSIPPARSCPQAFLHHKVTTVQQCHTDTRGTARTLLVELETQQFGTGIFSVGALQKT